jgi:hypothetical protein
MKFCASTKAPKLQAVIVGPLWLIAPVWCLSTRAGLKLFAVASVVVWGAIFTTIGRFSGRHAYGPAGEGRDVNQTTLF